MNVHLGPIVLQPWHIFALLSGLVAIAAGWWFGRRLGLGISDPWLDMALVALAAGRVVFILQWFAAYQDSPWSIFDIGDGGINGWASIVSALIVAAWRLKSRPVLWRPIVAGSFSGLLLWSGFSLSGLGQPATALVPAVQLLDISAKSVRLAPPEDGRALVINLWATWCPPCQREMPNLARAQKSHPEVQFLFVNEGESLHTVQQYLHLVPFRLENVLVDDGSLISKAMDSSALPMTLIYGRDWRLAYSHIGMISEAVLEMQLARCKCGLQHLGAI